MILMPQSAPVKEIPARKDELLEKTRPRPGEGWMRYVNCLVGMEAHRTCRFVERIWVVRDKSGIARYESSVAPDCVEVDDVSDLPDTLVSELGECAVVLDGTLNACEDIHSLLREIHPKLPRGSRLVCVVFNSYLKPLYSLQRILGLRKAEMPRTFLTFTDLQDLARAAGFEVVRVRPSGYVPWRLFGLGDLINALLPAIPVLRWSAYASVCTLRPILAADAKPLLSVIIPVRNEKGTIPELFGGLSELVKSGMSLEAICVEGNSSDGSFDALAAEKAKYEGQFRIVLERQPGKGKADAVQVGLALSQGELLTIFDADLSVATASIERLYSVYVSGTADFINGSRLVYPPEPGAMRFLNTIGNLFFSKSLSIILGARLSDSLCGSKLFSRRDYLRMRKWQETFGKLDPFGDFDLLFAAADLGLGILNVPVRYRRRTYGVTNIHRFREGLKLLAMGLAGIVRISMGTSRPSWLSRSRGDA